MNENLRKEASGLTSLLPLLTSSFDYFYHVWALFNSSWCHLVQSSFLSCVIGLYSTFKRVTITFSWRCLCISKPAPTLLDYDPYIFSFLICVFSQIPCIKTDIAKRGSWGTSFSLQSPVHDWVLNHFQITSKFSSHFYDHFFNVELYLIIHTASRNIFKWKIFLLPS